MYSPIDHIINMTSRIFSLNDGLFETENINNAWERKYEQEKHCFELWLCLLNGKYLKETETKRIKVRRKTTWSCLWFISSGTLPLRALTPSVSDARVERNIDFDVAMENIKPFHILFTQMKIFRGIFGNFFNSHVNLSFIVLQMLNFLLVCYLAFAVNNQWELIRLSARCSRENRITTSLNFTTSFIADVVLT